MKKILGISGYYHDSSATIIEGENIIAAAQEERFTRKKHTADFPVEAIKFCLKESGFTLNELDAIVFYDKPLLKFERLLETYFAYAPKGLFSFIRAIPVWIREKLFLKKEIFDSLKEVEQYDRKKIKLLFTEHHLSHAASAFYPSIFQKAAILTIDGVGEWATASISLGDGNKIKTLKEMQFPHSVGLLYSAFAYYLGFKVNSGEYKLMGLAPYGNPDSAETEAYIQKIKSTLIDLKVDGSIWMNQNYFNYASGLKMTPNKKWAKLFGFKRRSDESELTQQHCNLAFAIQKVTEEIVVKMAIEAKRITNTDYLCLAGGVALNCVANGKIIDKSIFKKVYIQPASGDAGGSLGAALAANYIFFDCERKTDEDKMNGTYLGPYFSEKEIVLTNRKLKMVATKFEDFNILCTKVAHLLNEGKVVGWFQGKMEFGPRALGNRSILGSTTFPKMQKRMNVKIKQRESFRPFAPSVLAEDANQFFDLKQASPYMLQTVGIKDNLKHQLPANFYEIPLIERLYQPRSELQAITHLDFSARVQTVSKADNPKYWNLLTCFKEISGKGILVNTSFNVRGEPIVCTPEDAIICFMNTDMDILVVEDYLYIKEGQTNEKLIGITNFDKD